jgi:iron complex outermembrane recepter protein
MLCKTINFCAIFSCMKLFVGLVFTILSFSYNTYAQVTDTTNLNEVIISGIKISATNKTALNIQAYSLKKLETASPYNLSDALSKIPGVNQMTTGNAISKPVIRGLYGNRVLVLLSGIRFDNQQWQDEHGLGLSQIGIEGVEIIKGPASLLYGTDAVGGVINIIEEKPIAYGKKLDINTRLFSNTLGTLTDIGYNNRKDKHWWRLRVGEENHADYADGSNTRVLNSRNKGYYLKAGYGFDKKRWSMENSYNFSYNQYGFIIVDLNRFFDEDARWSRSMAGPHHKVYLNTFSSQNTIQLKNDILKLNAGIQSNRRMEDEGGGSISLDMHLLSFLQNARYEKKLSKSAQFILNEQLTFENNTNLGKRILIPDAHMLEGNFSGFLHFDLNKWIAELGGGVNYKTITTLKTGRLNVPGEFVQPFTVANPAGNIMAGISYNPTPYFNAKANIATGTRTANLAELSSNGIHEGSYRYEIGDQTLKNEQNVNTDISITYTKKTFTVSASAFYNHFRNYIYLAPTQDSFVGFQIFRYLQQNATLQGGEVYISYKPVRSILIKETFSAVDGRLDGIAYLPFIPPYKSVTAIHIEMRKTGRLQNLFAEPELEYNFSQSTPAMFETATPSYYLINLHIGFDTQFGTSNWQWNVSCKNMLNNTYADHLSRLKYYGLYNQGINFILSARTNIGL